MKILIVEDEALIALLVTETLEEAGHQVLGPAATEAEALEICEEHVPDLAILDISLADGSSGIDVARELFGRWGLIVLFASGEVMSARQAQDVALGYLAKPYEMRALLQSVETVAALRRGAEPVRPPSTLELYPHSPAAIACI